MTATLIIGDYRKSSWSLRPWLALRAADVAFETLLIKLDEPDTRANILRHCPTGKVPALRLDDLLIHDSLAICEYVAETWPDAGLWPADARLKALARSACAEMHSGFVPLRSQLSFGVGTGESAGPLNDDTQADIQRIFALWRQLLTLSGSEQFLCGTFGVVDAMFAPVVLRLRRYGVAVPTELAGYVQQVLEYPPLQQWLQKAAEEGAGV
ncbi:glutathione S-transferase [Pseudomonas chlororaphis]|nr:glutathione S-transferase [Pseudomonas chlororaphis]